MSQTPDPQTPITQIVVNLPTAMYQVAGAKIFKLLYETIASQVKMADGTSVETRLLTLERALAKNTTMYFAENLDERDSLTGLTPGDTVHVKDATADDTVDSGGARYLYMPDFSWRKISEDEAMDVRLTWALIEDKPDSPPAEIDQAVLLRHGHGNKAELDQLSDDGLGNLLYRGRRIHDDLIEVATIAAEGEIPSNLRDGGICIINPYL